MRLRRTELFAATAILGALSTFACSGGEDYPSYTSSGGQAASTGGASTGGASSTGGAPVNTGGVAPITGGAPAATGGAATGGASNTGGSATGGASTNTGGAIFGGGGKSTGGAGGKGGGGTSGAGGKSAGGSAGKGGGTSMGGSGGGSGTVAFSQVVAFIRSECGSCHAGAEMPNLTTTNPATLYTTLTTVTVPECGGNRLVTPNDPSKSALLMVGTGKCGNLKMPAGCTDPICFETADVTMLTNWINSGAKNP